jgi:hypothetical protein
MVKQLNIILDDKEHEQLLRAKGERSWKEFIMSITEVKR